MRRRILNLITGVSLGVVAPALVYAGSATYDFTTDPSTLPGFAKFGTTAWVATGGDNGSGFVQLTDANGGAQKGAFVLPDLDGGQAIKAFSFTAKVKVGGGTDVPGQGWCMAFSSDPNLISTGTGFGCDFVPTCDSPARGTQQGLSVSMLENNVTSGGDVVGPNVHYNQGATALSLFATLIGGYNGLCADATSVETGTNNPPGPDGLCWATFTVTMTNGTVNVWWKGAKLIDNKRIQAWTPGSGRFIVGADTTANNFSFHGIDSISIATVVADTPYVSLFNGNAAGFTYQVHDVGVGVLNPASVVLRLDDAQVTASSTSAAGGVTTIGYSVVPNYLAAGGVHKASIEYASTGGATAAVTNSFTVGAYKTVPASLAVTGVDTAAPGFRVHPYQTAAASPNSLAWTEQQLLGLEGPNIADLTLADAQGFFDNTGLINYDIDPGGTAGHFNAPQYANTQPPGIPGTSGMTGSFVEEVITYLYFPQAGLYTMGVNSDDGFKVTTSLNPLDPNGLNLGQFDGGRGAADTMFSFVIQAAGYYPFRLLWENGSGELPGNLASCEWFTQKFDGTLWPINATDASAIKAYRSGAATPPYVRSFSGNFSGFTIELQDGSTTVVGSSIQTVLNNVGVTPTSVTQNAGVTTIIYAPTQSLPNGSQNTVAVAFTDSASLRQTNTFNFTVAGSAVATDLVVPANLVDKNQAGFRLRPYQTAAAQPNSILWTEQQMVGVWGPNVADLSLANNGWFTNDTIINYDATSTANGDFTVNNGYQDVPFPGLPGTGLANADNGSVEFLTWIEFPVAGTYSMIVNSDDGFKVTVGKEPRDQFAQVLGIFDGGRGASDTLFQFFIQQAGIYPMRLLWENGTGGANCEWMSVDATGNKVLINDTTVSGALKAYRGGPQGPAYASRVSPGLNEIGVEPNRGFLIQITDGATTVIPSDVHGLKINGTALTPTVTKSGNVTTISASWSSALPPDSFGLLPPGSTNRAQLVFADSTGGTRTEEWNFFVANWPTLPLATRTAIGSGDTAKPGLKVKPYQIPYGKGQTAGNGAPPYDLIEFAEQINGGVWDWGLNTTAPWFILRTNLAILTGADADGYLPETGVINYEANTGAEQGNFTSANGFPDKPIPGLPGEPDPVTGNSTADENVAISVVSYVEFPTAGWYTMGVHSTSGFQVKAEEKQGYVPWTLEVVSPAQFAGWKIASVASDPLVGGIGPWWPRGAGVAGKLVLADNLQACTAPGNAGAIAGNILLVERGSCTFCAKDYVAADVGAIAMIVVNNRPDYFIGMGGCTDGKVPLAMIDQNPGKILEAIMTTNDVYATFTGQDPNLPSDPILGAAGSRGPGETLFSFLVPQAGVYPLRMLWWNWAAGTEAEWFSVNASGQKVLLNSTAAGALKTYQARTAPATPPALAIGPVNGQIKITYEGVLQSSATVNGTYSDVTGATSPYTPTFDGTAKFYRARR